jgi:hypothetical protein
MRARMLAAVAVGLVVLGLALPAWAKGIGVVNINGPNMPSGGITISGRGPGGEELARLGLFEQTKDRAPSAIGISRADLGPKYVIEYRLQDFPGGSVTVRQDLYPYAKDGVWTYTPPGQRLGPTGPRIDAGWWVASTEMLAELERLGLPQPPATSPAGSVPTPAGAAATPATQAAQAAASPQPGGSSGAWPWIVVGSVVTVVVAAGLVATLRVRRAARVA